MNLLIILSYNVYVTFYTALLIWISKDIAFAIILLQAIGFIFKIIHIFVVDKFKLDGIIKKK